MKASFGTENYELEQNNTFSSAQSISAGSWYIGQWSGYYTEGTPGWGYNHAKDYYKVTATANTMRVFLQHVTANASDSDFRVYVYNSSESQIDSFDAYNGVDNSVEFWVTSGQTYYIYVEGQTNGYSGQYKIRASF